MLGLSVRDPWATLIMQYGKTTENRTRRVQYRGSIVICASKAVNRLDEEEWADIAKTVGLGKRGWRSLMEEIPINPGHALGIVDIVG